MKKSKLSPGSAVWIVARHSPGTGQTIDTQLSVLKEHCEANQLIIKDQFIDAGQSGNKTTRKEFTRMRKLVESSEKNLVDGVIFYDNSRLARKLKDARYVKSMLIFKGYQLERLIGQDLDGIAGVVVEDLEDYHNEQYLEVIRQKSKDGLRQRFKLKNEKGDYIGFWAGAVPWGFRAVKKALPVIDTDTGKPKSKQCIEPDYDLWPLGVELYRLRAGGLTCREIESKTNFFGSRGTVDIDDGDVLASAYRNFYRNTIYMGTLTFQELVIPGYVPAMVTEDLWQAANASSVAYKRGNWTGYRAPKSGKAHPDFLLAGLCECDLCQAPFYTNTTSLQHRAIRYRYYVCRTKRQNKTAACDSPRVPASLFEQSVLDHAINIFLRRDFEIMVERFNQAINSESDPTLAIERAKAELAEISKKLNNLVRLAQAGGDFEELGAQVRALKKQQSQAEYRLSQLQTRKPRKKIALSPEKVERAILMMTERLNAVGEARLALNQLVSKIRIMQTEAMISYKPLLAFAELGQPESFDNYQIGGYVIQLPLNNHLSEK